MRDGAVKFEAKARVWRCAALLCSALVCVIGCGPRTPPAGEARQTGPGAHVVQSDELREVMRGLRDIRYDRLPPEIDARRARQRHLREIGLQAARMADAARGIPHAAREAELNEEDRQSFIGLARQLGEQAAALRDAAWRGQEDEVRRTWRQLTATCDACHGEFRAGPVLRTR